MDELSATPALPEATITRIASNDTGEFPSFRTSHESAAATAAAPAILPAPDRPVPIAAKTSSSDIIRTSGDPPQPAQPRTQSRRTTSYLNEDVRFGEILRTRATSTQKLDPAAAILGNVIEARPLEPASLNRANPDRSSASSQGDRDRLVSPKPAAEDLSRFGNFYPATGTAFHSHRDGSESGNVSGVLVSSRASPAALQQALATFGTRDANPRPAENDVPASKAVVQKRPGGPLQGFELAVDQAAGAVVLDFSKSQTPTVGARVRVYERVLFKKQLLAEFEVTGLEDGIVTAKPVGHVNLGMIVRGDEAMVF
jgi:hypothetical protein